MGGGGRRQRRCPGGDRLRATLAEVHALAVYLAVAARSTARRGCRGGNLSAGGVSDVFTADSARPGFHRLDTAGSDKTPGPQHPQPTMTLSRTSTHEMLMAEIIEIVGDAK